MALEFHFDPRAWGKTLCNIKSKVLPKLMTSELLEVLEYFSFLRSICAQGFGVSIINPCVRQSLLKEGIKKHKWTTVVI